MSDTNKNNDRAQFVVSLLLVGVGAFLMLISVLTLKKGGIPESGGAAAVIARATLGTFGMVPGMLAGLSVLVAGCWIFLTEKQDGVFKQLAGALCTCLALSVLLGALSTSAGGTFGALSGGKVSELATRIGGALFGLVFLAAPVWLFWLKDRVDLSRFAKSAPRPTSDAELEDTGVSALEAEALAPVLSAGAAAPTLTNPYPEDVRLKGAVPDGATPLDADGHVAVAEPDFDEQPAEAPDTTYDPAVNRWTPERADDADEPADDDLAQADVDLVEPESVAAAPAEDDYEDELGEVRPLEVVGDADDPFAQHSFEATDEVAEEEAGDEAEVAVAVEDEPAVTAGESARIEAYQPPRPSWEEPYEDEVGEAVPLEVAEALEEPVEGAEETADEDVAVEASADELAETETADEEAAEPEEEYEETYAEADDEDAEDEEEYETEDEPEEELEETYAEADEDESDEDEEEYEEEEEPEEEYEETYAEADDEDAEDEEEYETEDEPEEELEEVYAEADEDGSDEDEADYEGDEELEEEYEEAHAEADEEQPAEELEETLAEAQPEAEEAEEAASPEAPAQPAPAAVQVPDEIQMDLFDEPSNTAATADSGDAEPEVVLEPQAAAGDGAIKVTSDMLVDAGNLFLQEGRVAVSMLQKRFALDFDQSCQILDELQDLGLIGPFVDGKRRDILLSSEEWLELTGRP